MQTRDVKPADAFLDHIIAALTAADAATLRRLEAAASSITPPLNHAAYLEKRATLAALLAASARNLRFLRRITGKQSAILYPPRP
jgi:hypothetical protein